MEPNLATVDLADLSHYSEYLYYRAESTFIHSLHHILPQLVLWLDQLQSSDSTNSPETSTFEAMWSFRKIVNAYISIIVHCTESSTIPENISNLSHYLGQIKDCLANGLSVNHSETQFWISALTRLVNQPLLPDLKPQTSSENTTTLESLRTMILTFATADSLAAADFHLLRKRIRAFMHSYAVLLEDTFRTPAEKANPHSQLTDSNSRHHYKQTKKRLKSICDELGDIHDGVVTDALRQVQSQDHLTFEEAYDDITVTMPNDLRQQIFSLFGHSPDSAYFTLTEDDALF